jgi:hypothetical protein
LSQRQRHRDRLHHHPLRTPDSNRAEDIMSITGGGAVCIQATALNLGTVAWMQPAPAPYARWKRQRGRNPGASRGDYLNQRQRHRDRLHHRHLHTPDSNRAEDIMSITGSGAVCIQATALDLGNVAWMQPAPAPPMPDGNANAGGIRGHGEAVI